MTISHNQNSDFNIRENYIENLESNEISNNRKNLNINSQQQFEIVSNLHNNAEKFDNRIEEVFKYLQVFSNLLVKLVCVLRIRSI